MPLLHLQSVVASSGNAGEIASGVAEAGRASDVGGDDVGVVKGLTPATYLLSEAGVLLHYLRLRFWPQGLCFDYRWPPVQSFGEAVGPGLVILILLGLTIWCIFRHKEWSLLGAWFFSLVWMSSILPILDLAAEHRMYLPLAAVVTAATLAAYAGLKKLADAGWFSDQAARKLGVCAAAAIVVALAATTYARNEDYRTPVLLWQDTAEKVPSNFRAHFNLGVFLARSGNIPDAITQFQETLRLVPYHARAYNNLGNALLKTNRAGDAVAYFQRAIELDHQLAERTTTWEMPCSRQAKSGKRLLVFSELSNWLPIWAKHTTTWRSLGRRRKTAGGHGAIPGGGAKRPGICRQGQH